MGGPNTTRSCGGRPVAVVVLALLVATLALIWATPALAQLDYVHDTASLCSSCHPNGDTGTTPTNAACTACHTGFAAPTGFTCWKCHTPGVAPGTTQADCTGVCHEWSAPDTYGATATPHPVTQHLGSNLESCSACHSVSASATDPDGSPHHAGGALPAPPTCTTCHASPPVDSAPSPHPAYVTSVSCATCHAGMSPHPTAVATPTVTLTASTGATGATYRAISQGVAGSPVVLPGLATATPAATGTPATMSGTVMNGTAPLAAATVYLQVQATGGGVFSLLGTAKTGATGSFTFTEPVKASLTLKLSGASITLGKSVTAKGVLRPVSLAKTKVNLLAQRKVGKKWAKAATKSVVSSSTGAYSWKYKPSKRGTYRVVASVPKSTLHTAATSPTRTFKVK